MLVTKHEQTKIIKSNGGSKLNLSSITIGSGIFPK